MCVFVRVAANISVCIYMCERDNKVEKGCAKSVPSSHKFKKHTHPRTRYTPSIQQLDMPEHQLTMKGG